MTEPPRARDRDRDRGGVSGGPRLGGWALLGQLEVVELLARSGVDFVGLDLQHGALDLRDAQRALSLLDALGVPTFVRLAYDARQLIPGVLEFGAAGVVVAMIESPQQAATAVALTRHQPLGRRSYYPPRLGVAHAPADVVGVRPEVHAMVETRAALDAVAAIAQVDGLAGLTVGPADLSLALCAEGTRSMTLEAAATPAWEAAAADVAAHARERGLAATTFVTSGADVSRWAAHGFDRIVLPPDTTALQRGLARELAAARGATADD